MKFSRLINQMRRVTICRGVRLVRPYIIATCEICGIKFTR